MLPSENSSRYYRNPSAIDLKKVKTVSLTQIMGLLSFMFLAMAAGAFLVPPSYFMIAVILEFVLLFTIPVMNRRALSRGDEPAAGLTGGLAMLFAACAGAVLGPLVQSVAATSAGIAVLGQAAMVTFIVFAGFGAYGLMTKRNLSVMAKVLFIGLSLDFQRAKYATADNAVMVTLSIFLDFVNLFTFILDIFLLVGGGGRKR